MMNRRIFNKVEQACHVQYINYTKEDGGASEENSNGGVDIAWASEEHEISSKRKIKVKTLNKGEETYSFEESSSKSLPFCKQYSIEKHEHDADASIQAVIIKVTEQLHYKNVEEINVRMEEESAVAEDHSVTKSNVHSLSFKKCNRDEHYSKDLIDSENINPDVNNLTYDYVEDLNDEKLPLIVKTKEVNFSMDKEKPCLKQSFCRKVSVKEFCMEKHEDDADTSYQADIILMEAEQLHYKKNIEEINVRMEEDSAVPEDHSVTNSNAQSLTFKNSIRDEQNSKDLIDSENNQNVNNLTYDHVEDMNAEKLPLIVEAKDVNCSMDKEKPCSTQSFCRKVLVKELGMLKPESNENDELKAPTIEVPSDELNLLPILPPSLPPAIVGGFKNWTAFNIPKEVEVLLSFGPKLCRKYSIIFNKTFSTYYIDNCLSIRAMNPDNYLQEMLPLYYAQIADIKKTKNDYNGRVLLHMISVTQKFLVKYPDIRIVNAADDKKCAILVYKNQYRQRMQQLLDFGLTSGVYRLYEGDFCTQYKLIKHSYDSIASLLLKHYNNTKPAPFSKQMYALLVENGKNCGESVLPCLNGTVSCHEQGFPCRPVFNFTRWLANPIKQIVCRVLCEINSNKRLNPLAKQLLEIPNCVGYEFVTYTIKDLYSTIDTQDIYSYLERFAKSNMFLPKCQISPELFLKCLKFSLDDSNYFSYDYHVYVQRLGLPQGAPDTNMLIKVYLDYVLAAFSSLIFEQHLIVYWWMYRHEFLVYMIPSKIESFKKVFKEWTRLELIAKREQMCRLRNMPTIPFFNLQITREPTKTLLNHRRPVANLNLNLNYLCSGQSPTQIMFETIRMVLEWTSTIFLLEDLTKQEIQFKNYGFSIEEIANAYTQTIRHEIKKLTTGENEVKLSKQDTALRKKTLLEYLSRFEINKINSKPFKKLKRLKKVKK